MTIDQFRAAKQNVQQAILRLHAVFLVKRKVGTCTALLYQLDTFYIEVTCSSTADSTRQLQCCTVEDIDSYLFHIDITAITALLQ